jgi:hypothetical protein
MTLYLRTRNNISEFRRMTSLTPQEFDDILPQFVAGLADLAAAEEAARPKPRKNKPGQGGRSRLATPEEKFFFMLVYYCTYPLQIVQGKLFGLSESQTCRIIHRLAPVMASTFALTAPSRDALTLKSMLLRAHAAGIEPVAAIDGTERPVQRPSSEPRQKDLYSGRFKQHGYKNLVITVMSMVLFLSQTVTARRHDKRLADECGFVFPEGWMLLQDTGFQGLETGGGVVTAMPIKKRKKDGVLAGWQKTFNRVVSSRRVSVEHGIGGCKRARIVKDIYRNRRDGFHDHVMLVAASMHNHRRACRGESAKALFFCEQHA